MAAATAHAAALAQPSGTEAIEEDFLAAVERRARTVRGLVRRTVGYENDALGLTDASLADEREDFETSSRSGLVRRFAAWFREALRDELLEPTRLDAVADGDHWTSEYIRRAYLTSWAQAGGRLRADGAGVEKIEPEAAIQLPVAKRQLRQLYRRTYENLEDISDAMAQTVREELTRGLARGENPRQMASRLNGEIEDLTNTRLRTLARTETINSHTTATLDRYDRAGVDTVRHGEFTDADDERVCPICSALDGEEYPISEFRSGTFTFEPSDDDPGYLAGEYRLAPPTHPNCRCSILPVLTE